MERILASCKPGSKKVRIKVQLSDDWIADTKRLHKRSCEARIKDLQPRVSALKYSPKTIKQVFVEQVVLE